MRRWRFWQRGGEPCATAENRPTRRRIDCDSRDILAARRRSPYDGGEFGRANIMFVCVFGEARSERTRETKQNVNPYLQRQLLLLLTNFFEIKKN